MIDVSDVTRYNEDVSDQQSGLMGTRTTTNVDSSHDGIVSDEMEFDGLMHSNVDVTTNAELPANFEEVMKKYEHDIEEDEQVRRSRKEKEPRPPGNNGRRYNKKHRPRRTSIKLLDHRKFTRKVNGGRHRV